MEIRCPKCDKIQKIKDAEVGKKIECTCSYKFVVDEKNIASGSKKITSGKQAQDDKIFSFKKEDYDFSRCICTSCGNI